MSRSGIVAFIMFIGLILSWIFSSIIPFLIVIFLFIVSRRSYTEREQNYPKD